MEEWYAVQSEPRQEFLACHALTSIAGVRNFLPALRVRPINPRARKMRPFFPGYLFVLVDLAQVGLSAIKWVPGVGRVLVSETGYSSHLMGFSPAAQAD